MLSIVSQPISKQVLRRLATVFATSIVTLVALAALSGVLLAYYYRPVAGGAYEAVSQITTQVNYGWLVQSLHRIAADGVIVLGLLQLVVMFLGEQFCLTWLIGWISGIFLTLAAIGLGWTAMVLDWSQIGYWRLSVELGTISAIPMIGPTLRQIITGGGAIGTLALEHLYAIHSYVLSGLVLLLAVVHLVSVLLQERRQVRTDEAGPTVLGGEA
jgi:cytochrome b6